MPDHEAVAAFIERIVAGAHVPRRAERDDLRRELWTHFEAAGTSPEALREAMRRFGAEAMVSESLRRVYRWDYTFLYLAKIAASVVASLSVALLIEALVNLRVEMQADVWRLAPAFSHTAVLVVGLVLALVTAWEVRRPPFSLARAAAAIGAYAAVCAIVQLVLSRSVRPFITAIILVALGSLCSKLAPRHSRLLLTFGAFTATVFGTHFWLSVAVGPSRALVTSAVLLAVWASTLVILARLDRAFVNVLV